MLIYCLLCSFISVPILLIGYYENIFIDSITLCYISTIHYLTVNIGMITSLAYANIERHFIIFRKNGIFTWSRQLIPVISILIYSYIMAILFTFIPSCPYVPCIACHTTELRYMITWLIISFLLPQTIMFISTIYLLVRLYKQRINLNKKPEWSVLKRITIQLCIYVCWSCFYYCPISFYNLTVIINPSHYSLQLKVTVHVINTLVIQSYSILTFISILLSSKRRQQNR